jgi:DNA polymerase I-like protein with 3'-5' exonuclease and polymerase domains
MEELKHFDPQSIELEHKVAVEIEGQRRNGWLLDTRKCHMLLAELKERKMECEDNVHKRFIPRPQAVKTITPKIKADGHLSKVGLQFMGDDYDMVGGPCTRVDFPPFNLGSRKQIGEYLCHFGWSPSKFTETGQPIVDEKILEGVNIPEAQMIAEYLMLEKRVAMVSSWVEAADGNDRVHGYVNSNGAVTGRMTHSSPNVAQVTANSKPFGTEMRQCWTVGPGNKLVGCDASGLELRMLAHYMNDPEYTDEVVNGDVHTKNMESAGLTSRPQAKTFIYAFLYGAGDAKIGSIVGGTARDGKDLKRQFLANTPALSNLRDRVEGAAGRGWLKGLDGRRVAVRSAYASLNTLLQSAGAIVMKMALVECVDMARQWPLDFRLVANVHDEFQTEVRESHADRFGKMAVYSIQRAGEILGLRCPLDAEYKIGTNWSETH